MAKRVRENVQPAKKQKKRKKYTGLKVFILVCVIVYAGIMIVYQQNILSAEKHKNDELNAQKSELTSQLDYYTNELQYSDSDNYIIKVAKERLGWLFPGETKYVETPADSSASDSQSNDSSAKKTDGTAENTSE